MKRLSTYIILCIFSVSMFADDHVMFVFLNDGTFRGFYHDEIDSISYSHFDLDSVWHEEMVVQDVWRRDTVDRISLNMIDSISYSLPETKYTSEVIKLDERYLPYILDHDEMSITFSLDLPDYLWPKEGSVLLYEGSNSIFPNGFAGIVSKLVGGVAVCDSASVDDVYEKMYFFGSYVLAENGEGTGEYSANQIRSRHSEDEWEDWGIFEVNPTDIPFEKIKIANKIDFTSVNMFAAISGTITPTATVEASFVNNVYEPLIFFKATNRFEYDALLQVGFNKDFTPKHHKEIGKPFKMFKLDENSDEKGFHLYFINEIVPIPQCPVINVGFKMGLFIDPKVEAEAVLGLHIKASEDKVHTYRLDKNNIGQLGEWWKGNGPEPETSSIEPEFEGTLTGSVWAGLMAAVNVGIGTDKSGIKEEVSARIGPYLEGKLNLDILALNEDMSWYSGLKESKFKRGIKSAFDLDFTAKIPKVFSYTWTQLELAPQRLWKEQECYLLPAFEAPTYSVNDNSLKCYTSVTRNTVPNHIGLRVKDESGEEVTKWQDFTFDFADEENPYVISETFENLDFKNHRYTIIPVTRIWELPALEIPEPDQTCVTCPDSNHPHLIDLGLPSGTKWLCCNVYAGKPNEAGGYYQWGNAYKSTSYDDTYTIPSIDGDNFQGTKYDAATANLGEGYVTPTEAQFDELLSNCPKTIKYSNWLKKEGVYLRGPNGAILYLPFSGYMDAKETKSEGNGYFVVANSNKEGVENPVLTLEDMDDSFSHWGYSSAKWYGYSVRPVTHQATASTIKVEPTKIDFGVVPVGTSKTEHFTVSNVGESSLTFKVSNQHTEIDIPESGKEFTLVAGEDMTFDVIFTPTNPNGGCGSAVRVFSDAENGTQIISIVGQGAPASSLQLSTTTLTLTTGQQSTVEVISGSGSYDAVSNAKDVATVTVDESKLIITGVAPGAATITVKDNQTQERAKIEVTVSATPPSYLTCPDDHHPHIIDLGLPSGTRWACCNVDDDHSKHSPTNFGSYYAWGEVEEKEYYDWSTYIHCDGDESTCHDLGGDIAGTQYDVAHVKWGDSWVMPSLDQIRELLDNCTYTWTALNGVNGGLFTGSNGGAIFLPATGTRYKEVLKFGDEGIYWSSSAVQYPSILGYADLFSFTSGKVNWGPLFAYFGITVRPVYVDDVDNKSHLQLSTTTLTLTTGQQGTVEVTSGSGSYDAVSNAKDVATVTVEGSMLTIKALAPGSATITVKDNQTQERAKIEVTVSEGKITIKVEPTEIKFVNIPVGTSKNEHFTVSNVGDLDLTFKVDEWHEDEFDIPESGKEFKLATGKCKIFDVVYTPKKVGSQFNYFVEISSDAENGTQTVNISGTGTGGDTQAYLSCPDDNHPHMIDLGLPSGTKWACCNVDDDHSNQSPTNYGGYYAWGEVKEKDYYDWNTYTHCDGFDYSCYNLGRDFAGTQYDVAHYQWGGSWVMPSYNQIKELLDNCTYTWTTLNGVNGGLFTGSNGGAIFLPAADLLWTSIHVSDGTVGYYWSSRQSPAETYYAYDLYFSSKSASWSYNFRSNGLSVRPVSR